MKTLGLVFVATAGFLFVLPDLMGPSTRMWAVEQDGWFDADTRFYTNLLAEPSTQRPSPLHPLIKFVWRPMGLAMAGVCRASGLGDASSWIAARVVVCGFAALSLTAIWGIATGLGVGLISRVALMIVGLLATSNLIASVPETYGISMGLLATTAAVIASGMAPRRKQAALVVLSILCAGSTITNVVYPAVALAWLVVLPADRREHPRWWLSRVWVRRFAVAAGFAALAALAGFFAAIPLIKQKFPNLHGHLFKWLHFRIYFEPVRTLRDWFMGVTYPIVGTYPLATSATISYGTDHAHHWTWFHAIAAGVWCGLLVTGLVVGLRDRATRLFMLGLVGWIGFNLMIHSVWGGPDNFLYCPHWSWALLVIAAFAARTLKTGVFVAACVILIPAQVMTLRWVASASLGF